MSEPAPPRHRRRERRRARPAPPAAGTSGEYASPAGPPLADPAAGTDPTTLEDQTAHADPAGTAAAPPDRPDPPDPPDRLDPPDPPDRPDPPDPPDPPDRPDPPAKARRGDAERGLRGIVGAGPSQVGERAAMRARDAARPTAVDLATAERDLLIVRRHYVPPADQAKPGD